MTIILVGHEDIQCGSPHTMRIVSGNSEPAPPGRKFLVGWRTNLRKQASGKDLVTWTLSKPLLLYPASNQDSVTMERK